MKKILMVLIIFTVSLSTISHASWFLPRCLKVLLGQRQNTAGRRTDSVLAQGGPLKNEDSQAASFEPRDMIKSQEIISQLVEIQEVAIKGRLTRLF